MKNKFEGEGVVKDSDNFTVYRIRISLFVFLAYFADLIAWALGCGETEV
jgi:hypothetical protein